MFLRHGCDGSVFSYQVACDARQCVNNHQFCAACIHLWTNQSFTSEGRNKCPVCRVTQPESYAPNKEAANEMAGWAVQCVESSCRWRGVLKDYRRHLRDRHQKYLYSSSVSYPGK